MTNKPNHKNTFRRERSAGVILFRDTPQSPSRRLYLLLDYGRHWDYPKGHVESGEDDLAAATRELTEETGITEIGLVPGFREEITYFFRAGKKGHVRKTVVFFLACTSTEQVILSDEHVGYAWFPAEQALQHMKYPSAKKLLTAAEQRLAEPQPLPADHDQPHE
ncbi:MAG TPA: NUDIX domain-containing protein [Tepidisphaeraceae bacterium]|nr:NUDIX domain-containing protein [Tepidisphaeraceae bacterium]